MRFVYMLRLCVVYIVSMFFISNSQAVTIDDIAKEFPAIYSKLSKLASSAVSAMSVDSAGMLLAEVNKRIKGVQTVLRINSSGMVINEIAQSGSTNAMRSVADQKWFIDIKDKNTAYFGSSREAGGMNYLLFWAWPIQTSSGSFGGVLAVKLDAASICQGICSGDSVHFAAFYNENLLYRCGNDSYTFKEESVWLLPDSSKITLRFGAKAVPAIEIDQNVGIETEKPQIVNPVKDNYVVSKTNNNNPDSRKQVQTRVKKSGGSNLLLYILLSITLVSGFLLFQAQFNKRFFVSLINRKKSVEQPGVHDENDSEMLSSGSLNTEMVNVDEVDKEELMGEEPENIHSEVTVQTKDEFETSEVHDETGPLSAEAACEKIKELIEDSGSVSFESESLTSSLLSSTDEALRRELYMEIHGQIIHWVACESSRLSQSLKELSDRVGKLENASDPEVMRIRNEANRISKEISAFKDNPSGQVSE